jgi:hypothetical protein
MNWYEWETQGDFDAWHNPLCVRLGYPIISNNQATGKPDPSAQQTVAYTSTIKIGNKVIAIVEDEYAENLKPTNLRPPLPEKLGNL